MPKPKNPHRNGEGFCYLYGMLELDLKIVSGIIKADSLDYLSEQFHVVRCLPSLDPGTEQITENSAEVLMPGEGEETARICQHPHKPAEQAYVGQSRHLAKHPIFLIIKPPA